MACPPSGGYVEQFLDRTFQRDSCPESRAINLKGSPMTNPKLEAPTPQNSHTMDRLEAEVRAKGMTVFARVIMRRAPRRLDCRCARPKC
jgi:hypothetical protein